MVLPNQTLTWTVQHAADKWYIMDAVYMSGGCAVHIVFAGAGVARPGEDCDTTACMDTLHATAALCLSQVHDGEEFNTVAAGEDIGVVVTFRNPLQVKLALSRVRLHVQFTPADKQAAGAAAPAAGTAGAAGAAVNPEEVLVMESQFSLHPGVWVGWWLKNMQGSCQRTHWAA